MREFEGDKYLLITTLYSPNRVAKNSKKEGDFSQNNWFFPKNRSVVCYDIEFLVIQIPLKSATVTLEDCT